MKRTLRAGPFVFRDPVLLCGVLYGLLWFDASGFLRIGLWAAFLHECGHVAAYLAMLHEMPTLEVNMTGFCMRTRGKALVWALRQGSETICKVGAYALANRQAYMACGQTARPLRGKGIGGRLIVQMANELAAKGEHPVFLCSPERVRFYTRLGFEKRFCQLPQ